MSTILSRKVIHLTQEQSKIVNEFFAQFPTEEDCIEAICKLIEPKRCPLCGSEQLVRSYGSRISYCKSCRGKTYCTGNTFFHRIKKLQAMLACMYFFEMGFCIPSTKLSEMFGISIATAQRIIKKISHVLKELMIAELPTIPSADFITVFGRRSSETPARKHPRYEQKVLEDEQKEERNPEEQGSTDSERGSEKSSSTNSPDSKLTGAAPLAEEEASILNHISDEPITFDELLSLSKKTVSELSSLLAIFEIEGLIKTQPGNKYVRVKLHQDELIFLTFTDDGKDNSKATASNIQFIKTNFGGCSRKYLNHFLALYWCFRDRARWGTPAEILNACLDYGYISLRSIYAKVTPLLTNYCPF